MTRSFIIKPKTLLLIDAFGAVLSTVFLGLVLVAWQEHIGMPAEVLYLLAGLACLFAIYSFSCYLLVANINKKFLETNYPLVGHPEASRRGTRLPTRQVSLVSF